MLMPFSQGGKKKSIDQREQNDVEQMLVENYLGHFLGFKIEVDIFEL